MSQLKKLLEKILRGTSDADIDFSRLRTLLFRLGFQERVRGDHFIYSMSKYEIIIYWSQEDDAYIAEAPELPGCMADGSTYQQAIQNVELVIQEWIETASIHGRSIPEPRGRLAYA